MAATLDDIDVDLEFLRMSGLLYNLNPRNFEDRWYGLWNHVLNKISGRIQCRSMATAQDSFWAGNTRTTPARLARGEVELDNDDALTREERTSEHGTPSESQAFDRSHYPEDKGPASADPDSESDAAHVSGDAAADLDLDDEAADDEVSAQVLWRSVELKPVSKRHLYDSHSPLNRLQKNDDADENKELPSQTARPPRIPPYPPSGSNKTAVGGTQYRVPDSALNSYYSADLTREAMLEAIRRRQGWTDSEIARAKDASTGDGTRAPQQPMVVDAADSPAQSTSCISTISSFTSGGQVVGTEDNQEDFDESISKRPAPIPVVAVDPTTKAFHDELKSHPPTHPDDYDPPLNPIGLYHGFHVIEIKLINAESKRLPSRREDGKPSNSWSREFDNFMDKAQRGNLEQIRVFFSSPQWRHQKSILLFATTGDFYTHTIATRKEDDEFAFTIKPWSLPTWVGSEASKRREDKLVAWLNETFEPEKMEKLARDTRDKAILRASKRDQQERSQQEREHTPPGDDNADGESGASEQRDAAAQPGPSASLGPAPPTHPTGKTGLMRHPPGGNDPGTSKPKDKGKGKARADLIDESEQDSDDDGPPLSPVLEADEGSDSDEDRPARKKARAELSSEGPPSTGPPSPIGNDVQPAPLASTQPVATTSTNPAASSSTQPAPSTSTQPAASTSTRRPLERRESTRVSRPVKIFDASGKKDAAERYKLKRARSTMN
ncbi:hypothetical protein K523DRAFT_388200 [Schizophyllum commune Tattone D]|nr:hypothetical protein K523DRAFT_388200 [Schizophyllum commune Tattone D]